MADNLDVLRLLVDVRHRGTPSTPEEQTVLARWSGWGAVPGVFDDGGDRFADARRQLRELLDDRQWTAARRSTLNAHYTDPRLVAPIWSTLR